MARVHSGLEQPAFARPARKMDGYRALDGRVVPAVAILQHLIREPGGSLDCISRRRLQISWSWRGLQDAKQLDIERQILVRRYFVFRSWLNVVMAFAKRKVR